LGLLIQAELVWRGEGAGFGEVVYTTSAVFVEIQGSAETARTPGYLLKTCSSLRRKQASLRAHPKGC
jgi:hypothetical protein